MEHKKTLGFFGGNSNTTAFLFTKNNGIVLLQKQGSIFFDIFLYFFFL